MNKKWNPKFTVIVAQKKQIKNTGTTNIGGLLYKTPQPEEHQTINFSKWGSTTRKNKRVTYMKNLVRKMIIEKAPKIKTF